MTITKQKSTVILVVLAIIIGSSVPLKAITGYYVAIDQELCTNCDACIDQYPDCFEYSYDTLCFSMDWQECYLAVCTVSNTCSCAIIADEDIWNDLQSLCYLDALLECYWCCSVCN